MSEILDSIVNCNISIESPVEDGSSFGTLLIIGKEPLGGGKDLKPVDRYTSLTEVMDTGWKEDSELYKASRAAFLQESKPEFIYIAVLQETEGTASSGGKDTGSADESATDSGAEDAELPAAGSKSLETYAEAVKRVLGMVGWYGLALAGAEDADYDEIAQLIESTEKIFAFSTQALENPLSRSDYMRTFGIYSENKNEYAHVAWLAKGFSFDPGSETWAFKTLSGVTVSALTTRQMRTVEENCLNYYVACAGKNITRGGKMVGGEWIDVIRFRDWLKNQMQIRIFELFVKNPKIPYMDSGIALVENQMRAVLQAGQEAGGIAETDYDADENPLHGYTVTVPLAASLSAAQRSKRVLPGCRFTARLAGAIHAVELQGNLVF